MHAATNKMLENVWSTSYLLRNIYTGSGKIQECENHGDDMQMRQTDKLQWMMSQMSHTKQSHKSITQLNHTGQDDVMTKNGNPKQCFGCSRATQVLMETPETC